MPNVYSTKSGNWSDTSVWDAGRVPTIGDNVIIKSGHTVTFDYNYDGSTNYIANVTVGEGNINNPGVLYFSRSVSTQLVTNTATGVYVNGGILDVGTESDPIPDTVTAKIYIISSTDGATLINAANNGKIRIYGSSSYYGNNFVSTLYQNWTSGSTIRVSGDVTAWRVGQELLIHINDLYANASDDARVYTITNVGTYNGTYTELTLSSTPNKNYYAGGLVLNLSRNVEIGKYNAVRINSYNSNRVNIVFPVWENVKIKNVSFIGLFYSYFNNYSPYYDNVFENNVIRNSYYGFFLNGYLTQNSYISKNVSYFMALPSFCIVAHSTYDRQNFYKITVSDCYTFCSTYYLQSNRENIELSNIKSDSGVYISYTECNAFTIKDSNIRCSYMPATYHAGTFKNCRIFHCYSVIGIGSPRSRPFYFYNCYFGYDENNNVRQNYYDFCGYVNRLSYGTKANFINCKFSRWLPINRNDVTGNGRYLFHDFLSWNHNKVSGDHRLFINGVEVVRNLSNRRYRSDESFEVRPQPDIRGYNAEYGIVFYDCVERNVPANTQQTRTVYIMPVSFWNYQDLINNDNLIFEVEYFDANDNPVVVTSQYLDDDSGKDWYNRPQYSRLKKLQLQFTLPYQQDVKYRLKFALYQANSTLYVDNRMYRQSADGRMLKPAKVIWDIEKRTTFDIPYINTED